MPLVRTPLLLGLALLGGCVPKHPSDDSTGTTIAGTTAGGSSSSSGSTGATSTGAANSSGSSSTGGEETPPYEGDAPGCGDGIPEAGVYCFKEGIFDIPLGPSALGDVNGDGNLDLVVLPGTYIAVALGDGAGNLSLVPEFYPSGHASEPGVDIFLGDFGGDGIADVAIITQSQVSILHGVGDGSFGQNEVHTVGANPPMTIVDYNQDGRSDYIGQQFDPPGVAVFLRTGGVFEKSMSVLPHPTTCYVANFLAADVNGDGRSDLLAVGGCNDTHPDTPVAVYLAGEDEIQYLGEFAAGIDPVTPSVGDYSGDSVIDVIVGNGNGCNVSLLRGLGDGSFAAQEILELAGAPCQGLVGAHLAQLDGLGRPQIVVDYFPGDSPSSTEPRRIYAVMDAKGPDESWLWLGHGNVMEIGDLNHDDVDDILFRKAYDDKVSIFLSDP